MSSISKWIYSIHKGLSLHLNADLVKEFEEDFYYKHLTILRFGMILYLSLFAFIGIDDLWVAAESKDEIWIIRYFFMVPFLIFTFFITYTPWFKKQMQMITSIIQLISGCGVISIISVLHDNELANYYYYVGLILVIFGNFTLMGLRFINAALVSFLLFLIYEFMMIYIKEPFLFPLNHPIHLSFINNNIFLIAAIIGCFVVGYFMERYKVMEFLARKELDTQKHELEKTNMVLQNLSYIDGLTEAFNRRFFDERIREEWFDALLFERSLSLIMLDVDEFKKYNDHYGHQKGNECLKEVVSILKSGLKRPRDFIARYGGEEFAIILSETEEQELRQIAEYLHQKVNELRIPHTTSQVGFVTISIGAVVTMPTSEEYHLFIEATDYALYRSKNKGKNCSTIINLAE